MESSTQISMLARQFDDLCKGFNNLIERNFFLLFELITISWNYFLILEFRTYAVHQEKCQIKWLQEEDEVRHLRNQLNDANQVNLKLQAQHHHSTALLKNEIKVRTNLQEEKKTLVK